MNESKQYRKTVGTLGQKAVAEWFIKKGFIVYDVDSSNPTYAPLLRANGNAYRMPDLLVLSDQGYSFVEVKTQPTQRTHFYLKIELFEDYLSLKTALNWHEFNIVFVRQEGDKLQPYWVELENHNGTFKEQYYCYKIDDLPTIEQAYKL